jgi:glycosyltransferase involved in cell wall biosynthesis
MKTELIFFLPNFTLGGAGSSIVRVCVALSKRFKITIISLTDCHYKSILLRNGINVIKIDKFKTIYSFKKINEIIDDKIKNKINIIFISNINYANALSCIFIKKRINLKLFLIERTPIKELFTYKNIFDFIKKKIIYLLIKFFYKRADKIISNSTRLSKDLSKVCGCNIKTIYPPSVIKIKKYKFIIRKKTNILTVARLSFEKNILTLIKSIEFINNDLIKLHIVGGGENKKSLLNYVRKNQLDKKIYFLGEHKNPAQFFSKADLYVNSSFFEGFPNSVVEAINESIPVIASHSYGGIYDIIKFGRKDTLFNAKSYLELSEKIKFFHKNKLKFVNFSKKNKTNIKNFTIAKSAKQYEELFCSSF